MLDARCSIENHRQPLPSSSPSLSSLARSLSLSFSPRHLEEKIKRAGAQRQTLIPPTPAADALLPTLFLRAARFQPPIYTIPLDTLAMAEGTTPSRETLPSREVLGWRGSDRWVVWVGTGAEGGGNCFPLGLTVLTVPNLRSYH